LDGVYLQPTREECFTEFLKAIPFLTISDEEKIRLENEKLREEKSEIAKIKEESKMQKDEISKLKETLIQTKESSENQLQNEMEDYQKTKQNVLKILSYLKI